MRPPMDDRIKAAYETFLKLEITLDPVPAAEDKDVWQTEENYEDESRLEELRPFFKDPDWVFNTKYHDPHFCLDRLLMVLNGMFDKVQSTYPEAEYQSSESKVRRPRWFQDQTVNTSVLVGGRLETLKSIVDHALAYGSRSNLAFKLVVFEDDSFEMQDMTWEALTAMGMCHRIRPPSDRNTGIYGVHTNSYEWHFLHLGPHGEHSTLRLSWGTDKSRILALLEKISKQAFDLAQNAGASDSSDE
ncbi:hypothetical protein BJX64DRAFT_286719 [Aspergillus heterothallicus]